MPPTGEDPAVKEIVSRLVALYKPERIYLFGSAARGDAGVDSDYDLMVVVPDDTPRELRHTREIFRLLMDIDAPIDVPVKTSSTSGCTWWPRSPPP
jgi:uncharacterized protein